MWPGWQCSNREFKEDEVISNELKYLYTLLLMVGDSVLKLTFDGLMDQLQWFLLMHYLLVNFYY